ncbi:MAG TPA: tripartite tricarboxylate transporter substrate binding protein [Ramlibacter sp.]|nr:tripartite tricarboxylate transporter substrate binding protein [Ramlibacter sp.]
MKRLVEFVLSIACACAAIPAAHAQEQPKGIVKVVVTNSAGTQMDAIARVLAEELAKVLGQAIVVENRPGADQIIGLEHVLKQPADGNTLVVTANTGFVTLPVTSKSLRFDPLKDFVAVAGLVEGRSVFGSASTMPWKTFQEFLRQAKEKPGKLNYASASPTSRLLTEALLRAPSIGIQMTAIPYASTSSYVQGIVAGDVHFAMMSETVALTLGERFRPLVVTGTTRMAAYPEVPTFQELGYPQFRGQAYSALVRAGTPQAVRERYSAAISQVLKEPAVKARFANLQLEVLPDTSADAATRSLREEAHRNAETAKAIGLTN